MALEFIEVIDLTTEKDEDRNRTVTFSHTYWKDEKDAAILSVLGGLSHATKFTFDKINAQKLVDFLQKRIINQED